MRTSPVTAGQQATATQYNKLRNDAFAASWLLPHEQAVPNLTLYVEQGTSYFGLDRVDFAGGNSPSFTAPSTNPRIDVLSMDSTGTIVRTAGVEAGSPVPPSLPQGCVPIAQIYNRVGQTTIRDVDDSINGYIYKDIRPAMTIDAFGYCGDGSDGDIVISSPTTLTRHMYYNTLVVNDVLTTDGWKIFVKGKISGNGTITWGTPNNGNNGSSGGQGGGSGASQSGSGPLKNVGGTKGGNGNSGGGTGPGQVGTNAANATAVVGSQGPRGGNGGNCSPYSGGTAGAQGSITTPVVKVGAMRTLSFLMKDIDVSNAFADYTVSSQATGGGSGANSSSGPWGGPGGGGGASGGIVWIACKEWAGTFTIKSVGANGGSAGTNTGSNAAGGGGGGGGNGGNAFILYFIKSWTGSYNFTAGSGGSPSAGAGTGTIGSAGSNGINGSAYEIDLRIS